ncbi:MAG: NADH-quinone oxidoreductase subunit N [Prevotellaceae bacterium]|nr:NADH-quinone oxidoreductase subunit N [Prevotellaceae bacterium]
MDLTNYLLMRQEISLMVVFLILIIYDLFATDKKFFQPVACGLFALHTVIGFLPWYVGESFSGMYVSGDIEVAVKNILNIGVLIVFLQANSWLVKDGTLEKRGEYYLLTLSTLLGMYLMVSAGNFMLFYIGLETASLPMAALIAFDKYTHNSAEAGAKYMFNAVFSSAIMLFGISLLYGTVGTLYFTDMVAALTNPTALTVMAMVFTLAGLFFKISLVPFHFWTADTYEGAPTNVTAYLSTISKGAAVFTLMSILYRVFGNFVTEWQAVLWWLVLISITIGNLFAMRQKNIKRFLAFSSISQAGYIVLAIMSGSAWGMSSTVYYILVYAVSNLAAFGVVNIIDSRTGKVKISDYNNLYQTNPKLALVMMIAMFSLGGIPPTAGFFSKFFVFTAAGQQGEYVLLFLALVNTVISLYYYLLVVKAMFIGDKEGTPAIEPIRSDIYLKLSFVICLAGIFVLGFTSGIYGYLESISFGILK